MVQSMHRITAYFFCKFGYYEKHKTNIIMHAIIRTGRSRRIIIGIIIFIDAVLIAAAIYIHTLLPIITGYAAKNLCSAVFVSERSQEEVENLDLNFSFISYVKSNVDTVKKTVTSKFLWGKSTAVYRDGFGVTLLQDKEVDDIKYIVFPEIKPGFDGDTIMWPLGNILPDSLTGADMAALGSVADKLVNEGAYGGTAFAFIVTHRGIPVAEAYKSGMNRDTRLLSWSVAKSVTNALVGLAVKDGIMDIKNSDLLEEWSGDDRKNITIENLMHMQSGLEWNEDYGNRSDVTVMLHCMPDFAEYAYSMPLEYEPGSHWYYSSGSTNILSYILRQCFEDDDEYYSYPHEKLFYKIGITDAIFETDESGTLVGSSYLYMTARDYARFALLYLNDGIFNGERILPEGWVDYTVSPAPASGGEYGSFFWLNTNGYIESAPGEMFMCRGHDGQRIFILPSHDLAVVVLGYSPDDSMDFNMLVKDIIETVQ